MKTETSTIIQCICEKDIQKAKFVDDFLNLVCVSCNKKYNKSDKDNLSDKILVENIVPLSRRDFAKEYCTTCSINCEVPGCFRDYSKQGPLKFEIPVWKNNKEIDLEKFKQIIYRYPLVPVMYLLYLKDKKHVSFNTFTTLRETLEPMYTLLTKEFNNDVALMIRYLNGAWWKVKLSTLANSLHNAKIRSINHRPTVFIME